MHRFIIQKNTEKINGQKKVPMLGSYYIGSDMCWIPMSIFSKSHTASSSSTS